MSFPHVRINEKNDDGYRVLLSFELCFHSLENIENDYVDENVSFKM